MLRLTTFPEVPFYTYQVTLDGETYRLTYSWNERACSWYLDVAAADDTPLISGQRIGVDYPLIGRNNDPRLPPGSIQAISLDADNNADPGRS